MPDDFLPAALAAPLMLVGAAAAIYVVTRCLDRWVRSSE